MSALARRAAELDLPFFRLSGATGAGVPAVLEAAWQRLAEARASSPEALTAPAAPNAGAAKTVPSRATRHAEIPATRHR